MPRYKGNLVLVFLMFWLFSQRGYSICTEQFASIFAAVDKTAAMKEFKIVYTDLLDQLGTELQPQDLLWMAKNDPFGLPSELVISSNSFKDALSQMKGLMFELSLFEPDLTLQLSELLKSRVKSGSQVKEREEVVQREELIHPILPIPLPTKAIRYSRDGKILYYSTQKFIEHPMDFEFYNLRNQKLKHHFDFPNIQDLIVDENGTAYVLTQDKLFRTQLLDDKGNFKKALELEELSEFNEEQKGVVRTDNLHFVSGGNLLVRLGNAPALVIDPKSGTTHPFSWSSSYSDSFFQVGNNQLIANRHLITLTLPIRLEKFVVQLFKLDALTRPSIGGFLTVKDLAINHRRGGIVFLKPEDAKGVLALAIEDDTEEKLIRPLNLIRFNVESQTASKIQLKGILADPRTLPETHYFDGIYPLNNPSQVLLRARASSFRFFLLNTQTQETKQLDLMEYLRGNDFAKEIIDAEEWKELQIRVIPNTNILVLANGVGTRYYRLDISDFLKANE